MHEYLPTNWQLDPLGHQHKIGWTGNGALWRPSSRLIQTILSNRETEFWYYRRKSNTLLELELEYWLRMKLFEAPSELFTMLIFMYLELQWPMQVAGLVRDSPNMIARSEEHTSELQSHS